MKQKNLSHFNKVLGVLALMMVLSACSKENPTFSLLADEQAFKQDATLVNSQIDMLWVVDNSSSMSPLQSNMVSNFNSFISNFVSKGYDFQIAVTTTDAYLALSQFDNVPSAAKFRDGANGTYTNVFVINPLTPNLNSTFVTNATQGQNGSGDERAFSSIKAALNSSLNAGFLRPNAFFAVVILSDEDDFSDPTRPEGSWLSWGGIPDHDYNDPNLESVASYVSYLDGLTNSTAQKRTYNVSAIAVIDQTCLTQHQVQSPSSIIGQRYMDIANQTNGVLGSICDASYSTSLNSIQEKVLELNTQFYLTRTPLVSSIVVTVNGATVSQDATNGWTYNSTANSIVFHGTAIPAANASIAVNFDPTSVL